MKRALVSIVVLFCLVCCVGGCGGPSPDQFTFRSTSPITISRDGVEITVQKYTEALDNKWKYGKAFYAVNNAFFFSVKNISGTKIKATPFMDSFLEDNLGNKYSYTSIFNTVVELDVATVLKGPAYAGMQAGQSFRNIVIDAELAPGEIRNGVVLFDKLNDGVISARVVMPKVINAADNPSGAFVWTYTITQKPQQ